MPSHAVELLAAVRSVSSRLGVRWYLFGAQAVIAYGAPRLTAAADVTVELGDVPVTRLVEELEGADRSDMIPELERLIRAPRSRKQR